MYTKKIYAQLNVLAILLLFSMANAQNKAEDDFKLARNLYRDAGDYATASKLFGEFILNYPNNPQVPQARLLLARSFRNNNRCELAEDAYEIFFSEYPDHLATADARRERAACLSQRELFIEAAKAFKDVQTRYSASDFAAESLLYAARNYAQGNEAENAITVLEKLLELYSGTDSAEEGRFQLAILFIKGDRTKDAQSLLEQLIHSNRPTKKFIPSALLVSGRIELGQNDGETAIKKFAELHERFPGTPQSDSAYFEFAAHLYSQNLFPQAGDSFAIAEKKIKTASIQTRALLGLADSRRESQRGVEALQHYERLLSKIQPGHRDYLPARLGQAIAFGETGAFASAVSLFHAIIKVEQQSESLTALRELGALYQKRGDFRQALQWFQRYHEKVGDQDETTRLIMAELYATVGDLEKSISLYRQMSSREAKFGLAKTLEINKKPRDALREYIAFLDQFPSSTFAKKAQARINFLSQFVVLEPQELNRLLQQSWVNELSGKSRQSVQYDVAHAFYKHHDFFNATQSFEHFAAAYPKSSRAPEAQFFLAESLINLAKQRAIENSKIESDSLRNLATQEFRVLASGASNDWSQKAQLRLIELNGGDNPDSLNLSKMEQGFRSFVNKYRSKDSPNFDRGLLLLADTQRKLGKKTKSNIDSAYANYEELRQFFPNSSFQPQALFGIGQCLSMRGDINAAMDTLSKFLQLFPKNRENPTALFEITQLLRSQDRLEEAVNILQELRWGHPSFLHRNQAMEQLGDIYFDSQEYAAAAELYSTVSHFLTNSVKEGQVLQKLARSYHLSDNYTAAKQTYNYLLENAPESAATDSIAFEIAILLLKLGDEEQSINQFLKISEQFPESPLGQQGLARAGHISFAMNDYNKSLDIYKSIITNHGSNDSLVYGQYTIALFRTKNVTTAHRAAKDFKQRFDESWQPRFELEAANYYKKTNQYAKALKTYKKVEQTDSPLASEAAYNAAMLLWDRNKKDPSEESTALALESLNRFVKNYPNSKQLSAVFLHIANHQYSLRNYLQAAGAYKQVIKATTTSSDLDLVEEAVWLLLKSYLAAHEYETAHQVANQILKDFPNHSNLSNIRLELGVILKEKGQYREAIQHFTSLLDQQFLTSNDASEARFYVGESYQNLGEYRKAIEAYYKVSYHGSAGSSQWITSADFQRAKCHESLSEYTTAIVIYDRIVQREGGSTPQGEMANEQVQILRHRLDQINSEEL
ncbi:MAG: tetratricopeptide repeat protein [Candidatus Latescibacterota bacterium]|nr:tetratricopeptide repeat protein [Candidatus Latescibacterota bacterium]